VDQQSPIPAKWLDHIPREENPERSLLKVLPLPQAIPEGMLLVLGTQRLDLADLPASMQQCAGEHWLASFCLARGPGTQRIRA